MTLPLSPEMLAAAYDYLRHTPPFSEWNMPEPEDLKFRVVKTRRIYGQVRFLGKSKRIVEISEGRVGRHECLLSTMSHEMIHIFQHSTCMLSSKNHHDAGFHKLADQVCEVHAFDRKLF